MCRVRGIIQVLSYVSFHYLNILTFLCCGDMLIFSDRESRNQEKGTYPHHGSFSALEFCNSTTVSLITDILMISEMFTSV